MRNLLLALALVVIAGTASAQAPDPQFLITPGVGIGPLRIGMIITDATKILGTPKPAITKITSVVLSAPEGALIFEWAPSSEEQRQGAGPHDGFAVVTDKAGMIYEVQGPFDNRYRTAEGLGVGSKPDDVTRALGAPSRQPQPRSGHLRFSVYDTRGIAFLTQDNRRAPNYGLVDGVWVFAPRPTS